MTFLLLTSRERETNPREGGGEGRQREELGRGSNTETTAWNESMESHATVVDVAMGRDLEEPAIRGQIVDD